jgi:hypothetical protein
MGTSTVRLDQKLVERAASVGKIFGRSTSKQIEHWAKIGEIMEDNPETIL